MLLDVCHMLKLIRNSFEHGIIFKTEEGDVIRWQYLVDLVKLQDKEGLRLGNKLTWRHINFKQQKMKVKLAAQLFSKGVADALKYCREEIKLPEFEGSEATEAFIRHVDGAFDVLNSRNPLGKATKAPMSKR